MVKIPEKVTDFRLYTAGKDYIGLTDAILPNLESITESMNGAGIAGEFESTTPGQFQSAELQLAVRTDSKQGYELLQGATMFDLRGAIQYTDSSTHIQSQEGHRYIVKGNIKAFEPGKLEKGSPMETSITVEVLYYKVIIDGETVLELDKLNYVYVVNGVDLMAPIKTILGN